MDNFLCNNHVHDYSLQCVLADSTGAVIALVEGLHKTGIQKAFAKGQMFLKAQVQLRIFNFKIQGNCIRINSASTVRMTLKPVIFPLND